MIEWNLFTTDLWGLLEQFLLGLSVEEQERILRELGFCDLPWNDKTKCWELPA